MWNLCQSALVPDLDHGEGRHHIGQEKPRIDETARHDLQQRVVPADHVNKDQVIDQFYILDFLLFLLCKIIEHVCFVLSQGTE